MWKWDGELDSAPLARPLYEMRVRGNRWTSEGIFDGDFVMVDPEASFIDGELYAVRLDNSPYVIKIQRVNETDRDDVDLIGRITCIMREH